MIHLHGDGSTAAVIVAAGSGTRFGSAKATLTIGGVELWQISVDRFRSQGIHDVIVVGDVPGGVPGGERRRDSVAAGLEHVHGSTWVLVHDAARPLAPASLVARVLERLRRGDVEGVVPVIPVADTVKRVDGETVVTTVDRGSLVLVQTPQGFSTRALIEAHERNRADDATDDAGLIESAGGRVVTVPGDRDNFKITYPDDLERARWVDRRRGGADA